MSGFWKMLTDDNTPRRAIMEFLDKATPKESPVTEELIQTNKAPEPLSQDMTPATDSRNTRSFMKRKLIDGDKAEEEMSTKKVALESASIEIDSVLGISDIPSQMDSPVVNLPKRVNLEKQRRVSTLAFKNAIEKNRAHQNAPKSDDTVSEASGLSDASIPLSLNSPDVNLLRRQEISSKKRISTAAFKHAIEKNKNPTTETTGKDVLIAEPDSLAESSGLMDSTIPSSLNSPELNFPQRSDLLSKKRVSTAAFKDAIKKNKDLSSQITNDTPALNTKNPAVEESTSVLSSLNDQQSLPTLNTREDLHLPSIGSSPQKSPRRKSVMKSKSGTSSSFQIGEKSRVLETQPEKSASDMPAVTDKLAVSNPNAVELSASLSKSRASTTSPRKSVLEIQSEKGGSRLPGLTNSVDSTPLDTSDTNAVQLSGISSQSQGSTVSSKQADERNVILETQFSAKEDSTAPSKKVDEENKGLESLSIKDTSGLELSSLMNSSIPSSLDSPGVNILQRPDPKPKKRVSTTAFKEALEKRKQLETPVTEKEKISLVVSGKESNISAAEELRSASSSEPAEPGLLPEIVTSKSLSTSQQNKSAASVKLPALVPEEPGSIYDLKSSENSNRKHISIQNVSQIELAEPTPNLSAPPQEQSSPMLSGSLPIDNKHSDRGLPDSENTREVALPEDFFPVASSTQMADKNFSEEGIEMNQSVDLSVSDIPSDMSNVEKGPTLRLASQRSKKRVSMTEFLSALGKRKAPGNPSSDSPEKEPIADETYAVASLKSSSNQNTSGSTTNKTAPASTIPTRTENITAQEENIRRNPVSTAESKSKLASTSTAAPPELLEFDSAVDVEKPAELSISKNRSRKSLKFDSPTPKEISTKSNKSDVEKSSSDEEDGLEPVHKALSERTAGGKDSESPVLDRSPTMKNSTVIAGGMSFYEPPLPISPIGINATNVPSTVQATPNQSTKKRPIPQSPMYMTVMQKVLAQKNKEDKVEEALSESFDTAEDQPVQPTSKSTKEDQPESRTLETIDTRQDLTKEPMMSKSKSEVAPVSISNSLKYTSPPKAASTSTFIGNMSSPIRLPELSDDEGEDTGNQSPKSARSSIPPKEKSVGRKSSIFKGTSSSNRTKGKSLASTKEVEIPLAVRIAQEDIVDRSRNFVPLEQRLKADPVFQAKVRIQRERIAAEKSAQDGQQNSKKKPKVSKKTVLEHNVASVSVNKANFRFYSQPMSVSKDGLDAVHSVAGEWLEFTLDQMGIFCANKGIDSLETWEDCYKMLKSQGIVKNYWEYSGLCHELLTQDECAQLLPSGFPSNHYESKRAAKRK